MRDQDGTFVIEISPAMRVILAGGGLALVLVFLFWKFVLPDGETAPRSARVDIAMPELAPAEESGPPQSLSDLEASFGVLPQSPFNIEQLSQADAEQLTSVFSDLIEHGFPSVAGEEGLIFDSLVETSARLAPNRSLRFFSAIEDYEQREFSVTRLYHYWLLREPEAAMAALSGVNESMRLRVIAEELPNLAETRPEKALELGLQARDDLFDTFRPDVVRPVFRVWATQDFSRAREAVAGLAADERPKALQGLALAKLDTGSLEQAWAWAADLPDEEPSNLARLTVLEFGIQENPDLVAPAIDTLGNAKLRSHLSRMLEAKRLIAAEPPEMQQRKAYRLLYSLDAYDVEGRHCLVNAMPDVRIREEESLFLRFRFVDFNKKSYFAYKRCFLQSDEVDVKQAPFRDLLSQSRQALEEGDLERSRELFLPYLYNVPYREEVHELMVAWSKKDGSWLGENLEVLDRVRVSAASFKEVPVASFMEVIAAAVADQADVKLRHYFFQGLDGAPTDSYVWGEYGDVTAREALSAVMETVALIYSEHEFGLLGYYFRDEDTDLYLRWPEMITPTL